MELGDIEEAKFPEHYYKTLLVDCGDNRGGINLLFASISDAANSSRRSQQYKH